MRPMRPRNPGYAEDSYAAVCICERTRGEGLVGFTARGGSSPLERIARPCLAGLSCQAHWQGFACGAFLSPENMFVKCLSRARHSSFARVLVLPGGDAVLGCLPCPVR